MLCSGEFVGISLIDDQQSEVENSIDESFDDDYFESRLIVMDVQHIVMFFGSVSVVVWVLRRYE